MIDARITRCKTALGNTWNTILVVGVELADTVPVNGGRVVSHAVVDSDLDGIAPIANNSGSWDLTVNGKSRSRGSLEIPFDAGDGEVILADSAGVGVGRVLISVDVESVAPRTSATRLVAVVIGDRGPWLHCRGG